MKLPVAGIVNKPSQIRLPATRKLAHHLVPQTNPTTSGEHTGETTRQISRSS